MIVMMNILHIATIGFSLIVLEHFTNMEKLSLSPVFKSMALVTTYPNSRCLPFYTNKI